MSSRPCPSETLWQHPKCWRPVQWGRPANASPGSHWGTLLTVLAPQGTGPGTAVQTRFGLLILVRVLGDVREKMTLESASVPHFTDSPPITVEARFRNEGTIHEAPQGTIEVR